MIIWKSGRIARWLGNDLGVTLKQGDSVAIRLWEDRYGQVGQLGGKVALSNVLGQVIRYGSPAAVKVLWMEVKTPVSQLQDDKLKKW